MTDPQAFYHVAAIGHWKEVVSEQFHLLKRASFPGKIHVGFLGQPTEEYFIHHLAKADGLQIEIKCFGSDMGQFEFPTQAWMHEVSQHLPDATPMLYFHTKGVSHNAWQWTMWRWIMNACVLTEWRERVATLGEEPNCAGVSWHATGFPVSYFPGTFWWATAAFVRHLTPVAEYRAQFDACIRQRNHCGFTSRHAAECWINSRCDAAPAIAGPRQSRFWDHAWWTSPEAAGWCDLAIQKGR